MLPGRSSRFAFCYNLTPYNFAFALSLNTDDSDCEVNAIVLIDNESEELAFALTAMVNLGKVLRHVEEFQTKWCKSYLCACFAII